MFGNGVTKTTENHTYEIIQTIIPNRSFVMKLQQIVHFLTLPTLNDSIMVLETDDKVQFQQITIATDDISVKYYNEINFGSSGSQSMM